MSAYMRHEYVLFLKNKKNMFVYLCLGFFSLFCWLQIDREYTIIEQTSYKEIEARFDYREHFLATVNLEGEVHPDVLGAVSYFEYSNPLDKKRLDALEKEDYRNYAKSTAEWYRSVPVERPEYFLKGNLFAKSNQYFNQRAMAEKMNKYSDTTDSLSLSILNEETAWQALVRGMSWLIPLTFLIATVLFSVDLFEMDWKKKTLVDGYPIHSFHRVMTKVLVAFTGSILSIIPLSVGLIGIGVTRGFGSPSLPVERTRYPEHIISNLEILFGTETIGKHIGKSMLLLMMLMILVVLLSVCLNILLHQEYISLLFMVGLLFVDRLYQRNGYGDIHTISYYPTSYLRVGDVVTGYQGYFWSTGDTTWLEGMWVTGIYCLVALCIIWLISKHKQKI